MARRDTSFLTHRRAKKIGLPLPDDGELAARYPTTTPAVRRFAPDDLQLRTA